MKKTPLFDRHVERGARMAPFGGWEMPIQYDGILSEHAQTRENCSLFDTCHMGEFELKGSTAQADLERILTQSISTLKDGQCRYGYLLRDDGGVLDDLTCYRFDSERFLLVVNAGTLEGDAQWVREQLSAGTTFTDLSPEWAKLDIQGPTSRHVMKAAFGCDMPELKYFWFTEIVLADMHGVLSRTGYTGEWGYELYFPADKAVDVWDRLLQQPGIKPAGLGARDTLRLEMGYPLYGHELSTERTPIAASRGMFVNTDKDFIGKDAVSRDLEEGLPRYLVGLRLQTRRAARAHDKVLSNGNVVGEVTSGSVAPSLGVAVAMAYVQEDLCEIGTALDVDVHGKALPAEVVELPFYKNGTARKKPTA